MSRLWKKHITFTVLALICFSSFSVVGSGKGVWTSVVKKSVPVVKPIPVLKPVFKEEVKVIELAKPKTELPAKIEVPALPKIDSSKEKSEKTHIKPVVKIPLAEFGVVEAGDVKDVKCEGTKCLIWVPAAVPLIKDKEPVEPSGTKEPEDTGEESTGTGRLEIEINCKGPCSAGAEGISIDMPVVGEGTEDIKGKEPGIEAVVPDFERPEEVAYISDIGVSIVIDSAIFGGAEEDVSKIAFVKKGLKLPEDTEEDEAEIDGQEEVPVAEYSSGGEGFRKIVDREIDKVIKKLEKNSGTKFEELSDSVKLFLMQGAFQENRDRYNASRVVDAAERAGIIGERTETTFIAPPKVPQAEAPGSAQPSIPVVEIPLPGVTEAIRDMGGIAGRSGEEEAGQSAGQTKKILIRYAHDGLDRLVGKKKYVNDEVKEITRWAYFGILRITEEKGSEITEYYNGLRGVEALDKGNKLYALHKDHLGSTSVMTDEGDDGKVAEKYFYDPFGKVYSAVGNQTYSGSSKGNHILYTGYYYDSDIGIYFPPYRAYDAELGRFMQPDPIGYMGGPNLYAYVDNRPYEFTDPLGFDKRNPKEVGDALHNSWQQFKDLYGTHVKPNEKRIRETLYTAFDPMGIFWDRGPAFHSIVVGDDPMFESAARTAFQKASSLNVPSHYHQVNYGREIASLLRGINSDSLQLVFIFSHSFENNLFPAGILGGREDAGLYTRPYETMNPEAAVISDIGDLSNTYIFLMGCKNWEVARSLYEQTNAAGVFFMQEGSSFRSQGVLWTEENFDRYAGEEIYLTGRYATWLYRTPEGGFRYTRFTDSREVMEHIDKTLAAWGELNQMNLQ